MMARLLAAALLWIAATLPARAEYRIDEYTLEQVADRIVQIHMMRYDAPERRDLVDMTLLAEMAKFAGMPPEAYAEQVFEMTDGLLRNLKPRAAEHFLSRGARGTTDARAWAIFPVYMRAYNRQAGREEELCFKTMVFGARGAWRMVEIVPITEDFFMGLLSDVYPDLTDLPYDVDVDCSPPTS